MSTDEVFNKKIDKVKLLFEQGLIKNFQELFDIVPYTVVAKLIKTNNIRFREKMDKPETFKLVELKEIAHLLKIDAIALVSMVLQESPAEY